jgi:hypothetical protein
VKWCVVCAARRRRGPLLSGCRLWDELFVIAVASTGVRALRNTHQIIGDLSGRVIAVGGEHGQPGSSSTLAVGSAAGAVS